MNSAYLSFQNLTKSYDGVQDVVKGISLDIAKGEFITFLGPSGSGKSTTLLMVAGFEHPTAGRIQLNGVDIAPVPPYDRNIGMVFQNYALFPHMNVLDNVAFPLKMRRLPKPEIKRRVTEAIELVNLTGFEHKHPREMSGGQQQRVALARAVVFDPNVLLLDEPLGALDKNLREYMQMEIKRIHRELGVTMIYVTHDQTEAMTMSDRVAVFNDGIIEQIAPPLELYARPCSRFVGTFVGDSNFFDGRVSAAQDFDAVNLGKIRIGKSEVSNKNGWLLVRPEAIRIHRNGDGQVDNMFDLAVTGTVHYGDSVLILGEVNGVPMRIRQPTIVANDVVRGGTYRIGWAAKDSHLVSG